MRIEPRQGEVRDSRPHDSFKVVSQLFVKEVVYNCFHVARIGGRNKNQSRR